MAELVEERQVVGRVCDELHLESFLYEDDAVASPDPPLEAWERDLADSDLLIAILWKKFGKWTEKEIVFAMESSIPVLLFVKTEDMDGDGLPDIVTKEVDAFVSGHNDVETGLADAWFESLDELERKVRASILDLQALALSFKRNSKMDAGAAVHGGRRVAVESSGGHGDLVSEAKREGGTRKAEKAIRRLKRHRGLFFGRAVDREVVADLIGQDEPFVAVKGESEIGRETLFRVLANEDLQERYTDGAGVIPEVTTGDSAEDVRHAIWEAFHETDGLGVDEDREISDLESLNAMVALLDVELDDDVIDEITELLPESVVAATMPADVELDRFVHELQPILETEALVEAFSFYSKVEVPAELAEAVAERCRQTGGQPAEVKKLGQSALADLKRVRLDIWLEDSAP